MTAEYLVLARLASWRQIEHYFSALSPSALASQRSYYQDHFPAAAIGLVNVSKVLVVPPSACSSSNSRLACPSPAVSPEIPAVEVLLVAAMTFLFLAPDLMFSSIR